LTAMARGPGVRGIRRWMGTDNASRSCAARTERQTGRKFTVNFAERRNPAPGASRWTIRPSRPKTRRTWAILTTVTTVRLVTKLTIDTTIRKTADRRPFRDADSDNSVNRCPGARRLRDDHTNGPRASEVRSCHDTHQTGNAPVRRPLPAGNAETYSPVGKCSPPTKPRIRVKPGPVIPHILTLRSPTTALRSSPLSEIDGSDCGHAVLTSTRDV
jgi:hypothetical protein